MIHFRLDENNCYLQNIRHTLLLAQFKLRLKKYFKKIFQSLFTSAKQYIVNMTAKYFYLNDGRHMVRLLKKELTPRVANYFTQVSLYEFTL